MSQFLVTVQSRLNSAAPAQLYLLDAPYDQVAIRTLMQELLYDPVVQMADEQPLHALTALDMPLETHAFEVAYLPGVTDNEAESIRLGAQRLGLLAPRVVRTLRRYQLGENASQTVYNPLIQTMLQLDAAHNTIELRQAFYTKLLQTPEQMPPSVAYVALRNANDAELERISRTGILALDLAEMRAIQAFYRAEAREPTDGELETLAQTWSEHCSHKTFRARVMYRHQEAANSEQRTGGEPIVRQPSTQSKALDLLESAPEIEINSLIKTFLIKATDQILAQRIRGQAMQAEQAAIGSGSASAAPQLPTAEPWVLSAFVDNAGIIAFGRDHEVSIKVETHNHPSALEPFGGANTGVGGVIRDIMGVSARPIANTNVLCFGPLDLPEAALTAGVLHPRSVAAGVVAGVRDFGNKLGIPTVNGAVLYEPGYTANPLVFCGTVGLAPRGSNPNHAQAGDAVVVLGGRTGRDGIHGATFSSVELTHTTAKDVGTAVQIGDPITEKKVLDVLLQARDAHLYSAITDCGAGGLSSAVGEMGAQLGVRVALEQVPLKYVGLQPWEIWLSEAQERMVIAVPQQHLPKLLALCTAEDVEASVIGAFTGDGRLTVTHHELIMVDLAMAFVHDGRPQRVLEAVWKGSGSGAEGHGLALQSAEPHSLPADHSAVLLRLLAHPNIASKERIIRSYDHEVGGRTVVKPLVGVERAGPGDAAVLQPLRNALEGLALGCGINPRYGAIDPYWMALAVIDEALRNVVAVGGDPAQTVILDNFCWGDPRLPDRMAGLVRATAGCYDAALAYGTPFVSGKDSLNNEYRAANGLRQAIPPTLLITALAHVANITGVVTMDVKAPGNVVYIVGVTKEELAGNHIAEFLPIAGVPQVPQVDLAAAPKLLGALYAAIRAGFVRACHDLSEGGLAVAAAEMAFAGGFGLALDLTHLPRSGAITDVAALFGESPTRLLAEVQPSDTAAFEAALADVPHARLGSVTAASELVLTCNGTILIHEPLTTLQAAWQGTQVV